MSTLQGESFYFHHGWHFLRADAFPMAKAVDAHRDAEGHAFYEADYRETGCIFVREETAEAPAWLI